MKTLFVLAICCVVAVFGDVAPYPPSGWKPQRALLVLPPNDPRSGDLSPQPVQDETESVDKVNESVMERLRQELGSDTGVYYVYLPDGKLQKVQYTTAPVKQQDAQQNYDGNNFQQYPDPTNYQPTYNQYKQSSAPATSTRPQGNQQSNHQVVFGTNKHSNQANQQQQYNKYQAQQQFGESRQQQQFAQFERNQYSAQQRQQNSDNKEAETGDPSKLLAKYSQDNSQNFVPASYVASVQFTDVPPITGPIFAYSPSPLVRVVRYASNYY